ncbi:MAG: ribosome silencing factor [Methylococcales bacterium]
MTTDKLLDLVMMSLEEGKGVDVKTLDISDKCSFTDYMVIVTGTSGRHVRSLAQRVTEDAKKASFQPLGVEGDDDGDWILVDLGDLILHVMTAQTRLFYQLEKLWETEVELSVSSLAE